jgi:hypothetical protein
LSQRDTNTLLGVLTPELELDIFQEDRLILVERKPRRARDARDVSGKLAPGLSRRKTMMVSVPSLKALLLTFVALMKRVVSVRRGTQRQIRARLVLQADLCGPKPQGRAGGKSNSGIGLLEPNQ